MKSTPNICLCNSESANQIANQILLECVKEISKYKKDLLALVLTGSFSRGEGSIVIGSDNTFKVLGDMEFLVVYEPKKPLKNVYKDLSEVSNHIQELLHHDGILCDIEFTPVWRDYFKRLRATIFNYELKLHGKIVMGDPHVLREIPDMDASLIPKLDGFFLLCNRIVEQLEYFKYYLRRYGSDLLLAWYPFIKLYLDITGSLLIVIGRYKPTYRERAHELGRIARDRPLGEHLDPYVRRLTELVELFVKIKLQPDEEHLVKGLHQRGVQPDKEGREAFFYETIKLVKAIWCWELKKLVGNGPENSTSELMEKYIQSFTYMQRVKGWAKMLRIAIKRRYGVSLTRLIHLRTAGTPQALIYIVAAKLYFGLVDKEFSQQDLNSLEHMLPLPSHVSSIPDLIDAILEPWKKFVRNA